MLSRPRHVLVTGGAGFLGSHLCTRLVHSGQRVTCVDNFSTGSPEHLSELPPEWLSVVEHDVTEPIPDPGPVDAVLHLASAASPVDYRRNGVETLRAGAAGTEHALRLALRWGARFLLASTSEVYGDPERHPQREDYRGNVDPVGPRSVYDEAKRYAEALTVAYGRERGADVALARIFNTYGPRMRADDGRMIPAFVTQALAGDPVTVAGSGEQTRSLCYVDDTVSGLLALLDSDLTGPVNIGNPHELTVRALAERVLRATGSGSPITHVPAAADDPRRRCPDISLARTALGWQPTVDLDEGLRRTTAWFAATRPERGTSASLR
ncbi:NAD-dependent epimerase/dehydratase family protein [Saccharomonospora saliphila]|uniref:NAD-dependent epimerase/dehydratase family protein n=1 Tax=Saccharomonospora saliphila TaxID=369829 RepID=UPI00048B5BE7|nr:NAD-dependent epimerase/dehydratase family protein [Saccharomonospora saliphila]